MLTVLFVGLKFFRDAKHFRGDTLPEAAGKVFLEVVDRGFWTVFDYVSDGPPRCRRML